MSDPLETLESSLGVDPVYLDPQDLQDRQNDAYLQNRPSLQGGDDEPREGDEPVFPATDEARQGEDILDSQTSGEGLRSPLLPHPEDSLSLETAVEDESAMLRSGRSEDFSEVSPLDDDDDPETLHPIL